MLQDHPHLPTTTAALSGRAAPCGLRSATQERNANGVSSGVSPRGPSQRQGAL
jgi:hypothetical protein